MNATVYGEYDKNNKAITELIKNLEKVKTDEEYFKAVNPIRLNYNLFYSFNHNLQLICAGRFYDAIYEKNTDVIDFFLARNVRPEARALEYCIENKHNKLFKFLYTKYKPFDIATEKCIITACIRENNKKLFIFIEELPELLTTQTLQKTISYNRPDLFLYLVKKKVPLLKSKIFIESAVPEPNESTEILRFLISRGFNIHSRKEAALSAAIYKNNLEVVKFLVAEGADIHVSKDKPLRKAVLYGCEEITEFILSLGSDLSTIDTRTMNNVIARQSDNMFRLLITGYTHPQTQKITKVTLNKSSIRILKRTQYLSKRTIFMEVCG